MKYKTHKEIDEDYIRRGIFSREEIEEMQNEFEQTKIKLQNETDNAQKFLKQKMGIKYYLWVLSCYLTFSTPYLSAGFGHDGYIEKCKKYSDWEGIRW